MNAETRRINLMDILCFAAFGLLLAVILVSGVRTRIDRYSCHLCRGFKTVYTTSYYGLTLRRKETPIMGAQGSTNHRHFWFEYSYTYLDGPGGCFGGAITCNMDGQYRDEQK